MTTNGILPPLAPTRNPFSYEKVVQVERDVSTPWLTLDEISQQLNLVEDESQDHYLTSLELATRMAVEDYLGLAIFPCTYRVYYSASSQVASPISLDLPEVSTAGVSIASVAFWNDDDVLITLASSAYYYDASGNKVIVNGLPSNISTTRTAPIVIQYTTNADPLSTYPVIKQAALLMFTHLYNNRSNSTETNLKDIPYGFDRLLRSYKPLVM